MADILALRSTMQAAQATLAADGATLQELLIELQNLEGGDAPPAGIAQVRGEVVAQERQVQQSKQNLSDATSAYQAAVQADPMHSVDAGLPLVLLPVRIETSYLPSTADSGFDLAIRVYPDDIHVDTHEPELTQNELDAGTAYWNAVWGAGSNQARLDSAWTMILGQLKPQRAQWAVHVLTPATPRPTDETPIDQPQPKPPLPDVPTRPSTFTRPPRTTLLPDHWHFIGMRGGQELFNVDGTAISDTLDVGFGPPGTGATDSNLPFNAGSLWLVDLDAAVAAGMAIRVPMAGADVSVDQLFVLGVSSSIQPDEAASRLQSALMAHQYTNGLGFLPPGTPTNNTPETRSAWTSAPQPPTPTDVTTAQANYLSGSNQNAALAAKALGIDGSSVLCIAPDALADQQTDIAVIMRHLWPALGRKTLSMLYNTWVPASAGATSQGSWKLNADFGQIQAIQDYVLGWVRSRGTLPVLRIANQPYGLLPALSLNDWISDTNDPTATIATWLKTFRDYWLAGIGTAPSIPIGTQPATNGDSNGTDSSFVNVLCRVPVSTSLMQRQLSDPVYDQLAPVLPAASLPGLSIYSELSLMVPGQDATPFPVTLATAADQVVLQQFQGMFNDGVTVLQGVVAPPPAMTQAEFLAKYKALFGSKSFPGAPPPDLFISLIQDAFTDPLVESNVNAVGSIAGFIICGAALADFTKPENIAVLEQNLPACQDFAQQFNAICNVDPTAYEGLMLETLDVVSHRLDAWITSLAARRLDSMRSAKPSGLVLGAYGWVENLTRRTDLTAATPPAGFDTAFSSPVQKFIHGPSMQHAATAAVLRAGYDSHQESGALAVNLTSSRIRVADWLAAGVRNGQSLGALLGYRFERGLHDATLDVFIDPLRQNFGIPLPAGADNDVNGGSAKTAILARNVVDGLALYRSDPTAVLGVLGNVTPAQTTTVEALLADLGNTIDAFGDMLLAESVHHVVGGNPLRAGLTADTVSRGEPIPDRFDVITTPRSGRPLTWQIGALLPADFVSGAAGWRTDRPRAIVEPHVNAWVAAMLGDATGWKISCTVATDAGSQSAALSLDSLSVAALDVICEASGDPSQLELRIIESLSSSQPAGATISVDRSPSTDGTTGFAELLGLVQRLQLVLGKATPIGPQQLEGANTAPTLGLNVSELDSRAAALGSSFAKAVAAAANALQTLQAVTDDTKLLNAVRDLREALIGLADHGIPAAWPAGPADTNASTVAALTAQAQSLLGTVQTLAGKPRPAAPAPSASDSVVTKWLTQLRQYIDDMTNAAVPIVPVYSLPSDSDYAAAFNATNAPEGGDAAAVMAWMRRTARIRSNSAALHDALLAVETFQGTESNITVAQLPAVQGEQWAGLPFDAATPPGARLAHVLSTPAQIDPAAAFCGFICDTWVEHVPGLTSVAGSKAYEPSEVTGMAFTVDAPSAFAPQSILLAVIPDQTLSWSLDILLDTVKETLDLAKIRTVDLGDLPRLGRVLPAMYADYNVEQIIKEAAANT